MTAGEVARYRAPILAASIILLTIAASIAAAVWGWATGVQIGDRFGVVGYALGGLVLSGGTLAALTMI